MRGTIYAIIWRTLKKVTNAKYDLSSISSQLYFRALIYIASTGLNSQNMIMETQITSYVSFLRPYIYLEALRDLDIYQTIYQANYTSNLQYQ